MGPTGTNPPNNQDKLSKAPTSLGWPRLIILPSCHHPCLGFATKQGSAVRYPTVCGSIRTRCLRRTSPRLAFWMVCWFAESSFGWCAGLGPPYEGHSDSWRWPANIIPRNPPPRWYWLNLSAPGRSSDRLRCSSLAKSTLRWASQTTTHQSRIRSKSLPDTRT